MREEHYKLARELCLDEPPYCWKIQPVKDGFIAHIGTGTYYERVSIFRQFRPNDYFKRHHIVMLGKDKWSGRVYIWNDEFYVESGTYRLGRGR